METRRTRPMSLRQSAVKQKMRSNYMERLACGERRDGWIWRMHWRKLTIARIYGTMWHVDLLIIVVWTVASARSHTVYLYLGHIHSGHFYSAPSSPQLQHGYFIGVACRSATGNCEWRTCPCMAVRARVEPFGIDITTAPPRPRNKKILLFELFRNLKFSSKTVVSRAILDNGAHENALQKYMKCD